MQKELDLGSTDTQKEPDSGSRDTKKKLDFNEKKLANFFHIQIHLQKTFLGQFICPLSVQKALEIATPSL